MTTLQARLKMRRLHFIELHEQQWIPSSLRDGVTDALQFGLNLLRAYAPIAPLGADRSLIYAQALEVPG